MELRHAQRTIDGWISQYKDGYWTPLANLARLTEEVGELARELNHLYGPKKKKPEEKPGDVGEELADILWVLIVLANSMNIDLAAELEKVIEKARVRDANRWERKDAVPGAAGAAVASSPDVAAAAAPAPAPAAAGPAGGTGSGEGRPA